jgi:hypothetical protein
METRGKKARQRHGILARNAQRNPEQGERYWARLRQQFAEGTYPNQGAYAENSPQATCPEWRRVGNHLEAAIDMCRLRGRMPARS